MTRKEIGGAACVFGAVIALLVAAAFLNAAYGTQRAEAGNGNGGTPARAGTMANARQVCFPRSLWNGGNVPASKRPCVRVLVSEDGSALITLDRHAAALDGGDHRRYALPSRCFGWNVNR